MPAATPDIKSIFGKALELSTSADLAAYLQEACASDTALRAEVVALLRAHRGIGSFLEERPPHSSTTDINPIAESPGTLIGPYKLLEQIGEGGFGVVFMAEQQEPVRRKVALKIIKLGMDTRQVIARFEAERQALALMDHPNIAKVLDAGATESGRPYFVMELIKGLPITGYCDEFKLTVRQRLDLFIAVCQAVQHAHQKGIIHRDIKPTNVLVTLHDGIPVAKIIDFGIAKATGHQLTEKTLFTNFAQIIGTPLYMSPEQAALSGLDIDTRSDIYSLGVLLYELLTGTTPFDKELLKTVAFDEIRRIVREEDPPKPSTRMSTVGQAGSTISARRQSSPKQLCLLLRGELDWIVMKALEKDRNRRYETASGFARDLQRYLADEPVQAFPPSAGYRLRKFVRRNKVALATAAALLLAALVAVGSIGWMLRDEAARRAVTASHAMESLTRARGLIGKNKLDLARQELAEAKGRIGDHRASMPQVTEELDRLEADLTARTKARDQFRDFFDWIDRAHEREISYETAIAGESATLGGRNPREAAPLILHALALYGVLDQVDWWARLERSVLEETQLEQLRRGVYEKLLWLADDVLTRKEEHATARKLTATAAARQALAYLKPADTVSLSTRALYEVRARCWQELGDGTAAAADEQRAKEVPPLMAVDHCLRGLDAYAQKNKAEAVREFESALRVDPSHYWALMWLGNTLCDLGEGREPAEGVRVFTGCVRSRPRHAHAYFCRANGNLKLNLKEALADYSKAIELKNDHGGAWLNRGVAYNALRQYDKALADNSRAIDLKRDWTEAWNDRGVVYNNLRQFDDALAALSEAIKLNKDYALAWYNRGLTYYKSRQYEKALAEFSKAIELKRDLAPAWFMRASTYSRLQRYEDTIAANLEILAMWPRASRARNDLACHLATCPDLKLRDPQKAIELAEELVREFPTEGNAWNTLGLAKYSAAEFQPAIEALNKTLELNNSGDSTSGFFLTMAHWQMGNDHDARQWYGKAVQWMEKDDPNDAGVRRFRAEAEELLGIRVSKD